FAVTEHSGGWTISDGGQTRYLLDADFERVVEAMRCAGALFEAGESGLEFEGTHESSLVDSVLAFAYSMSVVPAVWHSLNCDTPDQQGHSTPSAVDMMARETR